MFPKAKTPTLMKRAPVLAGLLAAPFVAGLGIFGFGDAESAARLSLEREAELASETVLAYWPGLTEPLRLPGGDILTSGQGTTEPPWHRDPPQGDSSANAPPGVAAELATGVHLQRLAALDAAARGNRSVADELLERIEGDPKAPPGLGLFTRVQAMLLVGDHGALDPLWSMTLSSGTLSPGPLSPPDVAFYPAPSIVPYRLAAFLAAGPHLSGEQRAAEAAAIQKAIEDGRMPLPEPQGTFGVTGAVPTMTFDPFWTALVEIAAERAPGPDWPATFLAGARRQAAESRWAAAELGSGARRWLLRPAGADRWLALTAEKSGAWQARLHSADSLDATLGAMVPGLPEGTRVAAFASAPDGEPVSSPKPLPGVARELRIVHTNPDSMARAAVVRQNALRGGLLGAGLLMALAAILTARSLGEAERVARLRSTFVASVSHDLRTPIASIGLMAETLREGHARGREDHYARSIEQEAARLRRIVDDLLDFGRLERGLPVRLAKRKVEVAAWIETFAARERDRCRTFGDATLALETRDLPGAARLDAEAVERALSNLIDNALKHSGADRIALSVAGSKSGDGDIEEGLIFEVSDTGAGLSKGVLHEDLFEPFARDSATSGTGLGLSIVRAIAVAHGGNATLSPGPDGCGLVARVTVRTAPSAA